MKRQKYPDHRITIPMRSKGRKLLDGSRGVTYDFSVVTPARPAWVDFSDHPGVNVDSLLTSANQYGRRNPGVRITVTRYMNGLLVART